MASPPAVHVASLPVTAPSKPEPAPRQGPFLQCQRFQSGPKCPRFQSAPKCPHFQSTPKRPRFQRAPKSPRFQSAPKSLCFQSAPQTSISPRIIFWGGYIAMACVAGQRAKATESPDPPWPPELPALPWVPERAPPWRPPVLSPCPLRPPEREGGVMSDLCFPCPVFPSLLCPYLELLSPFGSALNVILTCVPVFLAFEVIKDCHFEVDLRVS